jgi:hypothetical protein
MDTMNELAGKAAEKAERVFRTCKSKTTELSHEKCVFDPKSHDGCAGFIGRDVSAGAGICAHHR